MILYAVINGIPIKQIVRYRIVPSTASAGVDITLTIGLTAAINTTINTRAIPMNMVTVFPIASDAFLQSFAPMQRPIITVAPIASPTSMTVSICMIWLPIDTAVVLLTRPNCPTINKSAIPYSVCKKYDNRYGSEKYTTVLNTFPVVKSLSMLQIPDYFLSKYS